MKKIGLMLVPLLFALQSTASTLVWTIENAVFSDNTSLTGSFTYNSDTGEISNLLVQTVPGIVQGGTYTTDDLIQLDNFSNLSLAIDDDPNLPFGMALSLFFDDPLPAEGGVVSFGGIESRFLKFPWRTIEPGAYIVSSNVPLPGALVLMLSGLGVLARNKSSSRFLSGSTAL